MFASACRQVVDLYDCVYRLEMGSAVSSHCGSRQSPAAKPCVVHFKLKRAFLVIALYMEFFCETTREIVAWLTFGLSFQWELCSRCQESKKTELPCFPAEINYWLSQFWRCWAKSLELTAVGRQWLFTEHKTELFWPEINVTQHGEFVAAPAAKAVKLNYYASELNWTGDIAVGLEWQLRQPAGSLSVQLSDLMSVLIRLVSTFRRARDANELIEKVQWVTCFIQCLTYDDADNRFYRAMH